MSRLPYSQAQCNVCVHGIKQSLAPHEQVLHLFKTNSIGNDLSVM